MNKNNGESALLKRIRTLTKTRDIKNALRLIEENLPFYIEDRETYYRLLVEKAHIMEKMGHQEKALDIYNDVERFSKKEKNNKLRFLSLYRKGRLLKEIGALDESENSFKEASSLRFKEKTKEDDGLIMGALGHLYFIKGNYDEALQSFKKSAKNYTAYDGKENRIWAEIWLSRTLRCMGEYEIAKQKLESLIQEDIRDDYILFHILFQFGILLYEMNKKHESYLYYRKAHNLVPDIRSLEVGAEIRLRLGGLLFIERKDYPRLWRMTTRALKFLPKTYGTLRGLSYMWQGYIMGEMGETKEAEDTLARAEKLLSLSSYEEKGLFKIVYALFQSKRKREEEMKEILQEVIDDERYPHYYRKISKTLIFPQIQ